MRLPVKEKEKEKNNSKVINIVNQLESNLKKAFENSIKACIKFAKVKVMLGDFSVIETETFDPNLIINYFFEKEKLIQTLNTWKVVSVQSTKSDDLHRIYLQSSIEIDRYYFYIYFGIQFHSLLYYQMDKDVIQISKKIREIEEKNFIIKKDISQKGDQIIKQELSSLGYIEHDNTQLFEELFSNSELSEKLTQKTSSLENSHPELGENLLYIEKLKQHLQDLVIEIYQIKYNSLDYNKMMQGEEGIIFYIDLEFIKNQKTKEKTSVFSFEKIPDDIADSFKLEFDNLINIIVS